MRDLSGWIDFFTSAGVPPVVRRTYAQIFVDHRITDSIVSDLEKEHLKDMGIVVIGDIIAILKQCKKVGHEDPSVNVAKVSSSVDCLNIAARVNSASEVSSQVPAPSKPPRRVTPEMEGKYVVKQPSGITPRTRQILAAMKQRPTSTTDSLNAVSSTKRTVVQRKQPQPEGRKPKSAFGDSDLDECDSYRVILSKKSSESAPPGSVFARLGGLPAVSNTDVPVGHEPAARPRVNFDTASENPRTAVIRQSVTVPSLLPPTAVTQPTRRLHLANPNSGITVKTAAKRRSSSSVFSRLSEYVSPPKRAQIDGNSNGVDNSRLHTTALAKRLPPSIKPSTYTEGVLGTAASQKLLKASVKNRLGDAAVRNIRKSANVPVHARLGALR